LLFKSPLFNNPSVVRSLLWILMIYHSIFFIFFVVQSINNGLQMIELKIMLYFCVWLRCKMAAWCFIYTVHVLFLFVCASFITFFCCIIIWFLYSYTIPFCFCCVYYGGTHHSVFSSICVCPEIMNQKWIFYRIKMTQTMKPNQPFYDTVYNKKLIIINLCTAPLFVVWIYPIYMATKRSWIKLFLNEFVFEIFN